MQQFCLGEAKRFIEVDNLQQEVIIIFNDLHYFNRCQENSKNEPFVAMFSINTLEIGTFYKLFSFEFLQEKGNCIIGA